MSGGESTVAARYERRWAVIGVALVLCAIMVEAVAGLVREAVTHEPSTLAKVETCLTERSTPFEAVVDDRIALSAARGALRTTVQGNTLTVALGSSEKDAQRVYDDYAAVAPEVVVKTRLERHRRVVLLWDQEPTTSQRDFMYLCTLDAQD